MNSFIIASEENLNYLAHHGVQGQKWGVRHDKEYYMTPEERAEAARRRRNRRLAIGAGVATAAAVGGALLLRNRRMARKAAQSSKQVTNTAQNMYKEVAKYKPVAQKTTKNTAPKINSVKSNKQVGDIKKAIYQLIKESGSQTSGPTMPKPNYNTMPKYSGDTAKYINLAKTNAKAAAQYANRTPSYSGDTKAALTLLKKIKAHS